jgi:hypothetical protein
MRWKLVGILSWQLLLAGCGASTASKTNQPVAAKSTTTDSSKVLDDEGAVRACVEGWLKSQKAAMRGDEYWDSYTRTPLASPDLSEYASHIRDLVRSIEEGEAILGKSVAPQHTIHVVKVLNAVRSGEILNIQFTDFDAKKKTVFRRERSASVVARIESSKEDGTPIIQDWTVVLFKEQGKWGVCELVKAIR